MPENLYDASSKGQSAIEEFNKSFEKLNEYQKAAVIDNKKALLVNAHVGSGKTTVLIHKILYLHFVKKLPLQSLVVLTFTNKAAQEIKDRLKQLNSDLRDEHMKFFGTFHSVCRELLNSTLPIEDIGYTKSFAIADTNEMLELYDRVIVDNTLTIKYKNKIKKRIDKLKSGQLLYGNMKKDDDMIEFLQIVKQEKLRCNIMDFDDLIDYTIELLPASQYFSQWVIIDEFQDCDNRQLRLMELLAKDKGQIFVVGDPNQVIYSWRGGSGEIFRSFKEQHAAGEISLPINYRSTATILNAASMFLKQGTGLMGVREAGAPITIKKHHNRFNEAVYLCQRIKALNEAGVPLNEIAVFYRKQKHSEVFAEVFDKHDIPYEVSLRKTLKDIPVLYWILRLLKTAVNTRDRSSLMFLLGSSRYGAGISPKILKKAVQDFLKNEENTSDIELLKRLRDFKSWCINDIEYGNDLPDKIYEYFDMSSYLMPTSATFEEDRLIVKKLLNELSDYSRLYTINLFEGVRDYVSKSSLYGNGILNENNKGIRKDEASVKLMTLHASKGLEFNSVFISGANLGSIPIITNRDEEGEQEEKRLFFVGITRAKNNLEISYYVKPEDYGVYGVPSPYLRMIPEELIESEDFAGRASSLNQLRREIKSNIDQKTQDNDIKESNKEEQAKRLVIHDKYGQGEVVSEDENSITVVFSIYGEKTFSKVFCPLKFIID